MLNKDMMNITNEYLGLVLNQGMGFKAHESLWNVFEQEKSKKLQPLFGDKYIIEKEVEIEMSSYYLERLIRESGFIRRLRHAFDQSWAKYFTNYYPYAYDEPRDSDTNRISRSQVDIRDLADAGCLARGTVGNLNMNSLVNPDTGKIVKINSGAKIMKAMKNFISDKEVLSKLQTEYSQLVNTKTIKGTLCLSIHPLDYLTASVNDSGWTSCFNTLDKGEWCASTLSLISSPNTVIAYLKADKDMNIGGIEWNNKKWRTYITLSDENELIHLGRQYPYHSVELGNAAVAMMADLLGVETDSRETADDDYYEVCVSTPDNMYNDADDGYIDIYGVKDSGWKDQVIEIDVSPVGAICPVCGEPYEDCEFNIVCDTCSDGNRCSECDCAVGNNGVWIEATDSYVCERCFDEDYSYCCNCDEPVHCDNIKEVYPEVNRTNGGQKDPWGFTRPHYYSSFWCTDCVEYALAKEILIECCDCGDIVAYDGEGTEGFVCKDCIQKNESN